MKKLIHLLILFIPLTGQAQSGVMLPNSIDLPKVTSLATCSTTGKGKIVFNTSNNKAYYCNGLNWQEMTGGGFTLPYSATYNSNEIFFKIVGGGGVSIWAESNTGYGVYAKSTGSSAVKGSSEDGFGVEGSSTTNFGVRGSSVESYGVSGVSINDAGVYGNGPIGVRGFGNGIDGYGIYGEGVNRRAGYFKGDLKVSGDLIVGEDKGIIQNTTNTQLKHYTRKIVFNNQTLAASGSFISDGFSLAEFSSNPVVYIGNIENQSDDYYKVTLSIVSVTENSFRVRFYNTSNESITFSGTWNIVAVGPK